VHACERATVVFDVLQTGFATGRRRDLSTMRSGEEDVCSNATQRVSSLFYKSSDVERRAAFRPYSSSPHAWQRKIALNTAQMETKSRPKDAHRGIEPRVRYSASVDDGCLAEEPLPEPAAGRRIQGRSLVARLYSCLIVPLHVVGLYTVRYLPVYRPSLCLFGRLRCVLSLNIRGH